MAKKISDERKAAYYFGMILTGVGLLLFCSVFVSGAMQMSKPTPLNHETFSHEAFSHETFAQDREPFDRSFIFRGLGGMALMAVGQLIQNIGAKGLSGSGVVLDPEQARSELEPYSRMAGGIVKDALDEADIDLGKDEAERIVMLKCRECGKLNEENSKFCNECGNSIQ